MQSTLFTCLAVLVAVQLQVGLSQHGAEERKYLFSVSSSPTTSEPILRVSTEHGDEVSFVGPGRISSYCSGINNGCNLQVLKGSDSSQAYTVFVPLENGAWVVTISIGNPVEVIGEGLLDFTGNHCETLGVFHFFTLFVAFCSDENDYLHRCDLTVNLNNASSLRDFCGGNPTLIRNRFHRANGVPAPNAVQTGTSFETSSVLMFSGTYLYRYSPSGNQLEQSTIPIDCDFITRVQMLSYNNGSAYLYCNDTRIYHYNLLDSSAIPILIRDTFEGRYPCDNGIYSIANLDVVYQLSGRDNLTIILLSPVVEGICIGTNSLLYEDIRSLNILRIMRNSLVHTTIDSRTQYKIVQNLYVVLFRIGSMSITDANSLDFDIFQSSNTEFPPLLYLLNIPITAVSTLPLNNSSGTQTANTATTSTATSNTATANSESTTKFTSSELPTSQLPDMKDTNQTIAISLSVTLTIIICLVVIGGIYTYCRCRQHGKSDGNHNPSSSEPASEGSGDSSHKFSPPVSESSRPNSPVSVSDTQSQGKETMVGGPTLHPIPIEAVRELGETRRTEEYQNSQTHKIHHTENDEATL